MSRRWICVIRGHQHVPVHFRTPRIAGGYYLRCQRCGHQRAVPTSGSTLAAALGLGD